MLIVLSHDSIYMYVGHFAVVRKRPELRTGRRSFQNPEVMNNHQIILVPNFRGSVLSVLKSRHVLGVVGDNQFGAGGPDELGLHSFVKPLYYVHSFAKLLNHLILLLRLRVLLALGQSFSPRKHPPGSYCWFIRLIGLLH